MCLSPLNLVWWQTELGASSVADIADRQAGRPAAYPTCQPTRSESMPVWDHADTAHKQRTVQLWTERRKIRQEHVDPGLHLLAQHFTSEGEQGQKHCWCAFLKHLPPKPPYTFGLPGINRQLYSLDCFQNDLLPYDKHPCWCILNYLEMLNVISH